MVTVAYICIVTFVFIPGSFSRPQDSDSPTSSAPRVKVDDAYDYVYDTYDYGKQYGDYVKQYTDYVKQYGDYGVTYSDYGVGAAYGDYGDFDHTWHYEDDYGLYDDDYTTDYGEYFVFGDRNNPLDTIVHMYDDAGQQSNTPWVYIIVPVVQIDVLYVDEEHEQMEDVELQLPIETFFFELGEFGLGHFDLGDFGVSDFRHTVDYGEADDYGLAADYGEYNDYPIYGHYQGAKAGLYDTADELGDQEILDYPGIDHEPYWVDWIFMIPPDEMAPVVR